MIHGLVAKLRDGSDLTHEEMRGAMSDMLQGRASDRQSAEFLSCLAAKRETDGELLAMLDVMRSHAVAVEPRSPGAIDVCGTGGDGLGTLNISTAAAFVAASAGAATAKHGNRSSSGVGSADIFEHLGYDLNLPPGRTADVLERFGICFMFAPAFHPAMKHVAPARRLVSGRTAFNILGPLCNPAGVLRQLIGVPSYDLLRRLPALLEKQGAECVMTAMSENGMDELSTASRGRICTMRGGEAAVRTVDPESLGLHGSELSEIQVRTKQEAISSFISVLGGSACTAMTETVLLNAAAALVVAGMADDLGDGLDTASDALGGGRTERLLRDFVSHTGDVGRIHGVLEP